MKMQNHENYNEVENKNNQQHLNINSGVWNNE